MLKDLGVADVGNKSSVAQLLKAYLTLKSARIANQLKDRSVTCMHLCGVAATCVYYSYSVTCTSCTHEFMYNVMHLS